MNQEHSRRHDEHQEHLNNFGKFQKWRGLSNYDIDSVAFDVKTTNPTIISTNKHYKLIDLDSRFKLLQE